jgi:putative ATPase
MDNRPLADRMRPSNLDEFIGQEHILGKGKVLRRAIESDEFPSLILWGPPGSGKTTLAYIISHMRRENFISFSAVTSGIKEIKDVFKDIKDNLSLFHKKTIVFIDEFHRFNKAQQDAFLPYVEKGIILLIGSTTQNPSFEIIAPLLSRCQIFILEALTVEETELILSNAINDKERGFGKFKIEIKRETIRYLATISNGDARIALNNLELLFSIAPIDDKGIKRITREFAIENIQKKHLLYDKSGEEHYNLISALHKSMRGSDPDAALYWLGRMLEGGEDPLYIARRIIRFASEDVGNADPKALEISVAAMQAVHFIGQPEGDLALAQAVIYLSLTPKSNAVYKAYSDIKKDIKKTISSPVPKHLRNAPTSLMKKIGYGRGYKYPHNFPESFVSQDYLPKNLKNKRYYFPTDHGYEKEIKKRLEEWIKKRAK